MIQISNFGWRLGNQMFQLAAATAVAERDGDKVLFPNWDYAQMFEGEFVSEKGENKPNRVHQEPGFHYTEIPKRTTVINGYFQSEKYFKDYDSKIRSMFKIREGIIEPLLKKHDDLLSRDVPVVAVHLRRGDYLNHPQHHPVLDMNYFMKATKKFPKNAIFLVFSDDTEWCNANFPAIGEKFFIIEGQSDVEDFAMMTLCDHNVIANSSFSWWAAWLNDNENKIVVAPEKWFGPAYANNDLKDLYCDGWIKI